jgi:hypothetical protein
LSSDAGPRWLAIGTHVPAISQDLQSFRLAHRACNGV